MEQISRIGMDTSKHIFQLHGVDAAEVPVLRKKLRRKDMVTFFEKLAPTVIAIEACGASHHWARLLQSFGHTVKLIPAQLVKPYVKRGKNDAADAEALCEAMSRPTMRFVPVKTSDQQAALMPLWLSLGRLPAESARAVCMRFSPIGLGCVLVIAGSGLAQGLVLIGSLLALVDTDYGRIALVKISLFLVALALAALNRLWLTDRLIQANTQRLMQAFVASEVVVGLTIIVAAAFLASSMPPTHSGEM